MQEGFIEVCQLECFLVMDCCLCQRRCGGGVLMGMTRHMSSRFGWFIWFEELFGVDGLLVFGELNGVF